MAGPWAEPVNDPVLSALILRRTNVVVVFFYHMCTLSAMSNPAFKKGDAIVPVVIIVLPLCLIAALCTRALTFKCTTPPPPEKTFEKVHMRKTQMALLF